MDLLLLPILAFVIFFVVQKIVKLTKIAGPILYLAIGIIAGVVLNAAGIGTLSDVFPSIGLYNSASMLLMFFGAGCSLNIATIRKSGKLTAKLFSIPSYVETIVISVIMFGLLYVLGEPIGLNLPMAACVLIAADLAMGSSAFIIPTCLSLIQKGMGKKHGIPSTMVAVFVVDSFSTIPIILVALVTMIATASGKTLSIGMLALIAVGALVLIAAVVLLGVLLGRLITWIATPANKAIVKNPNKAGPVYLGVAITFGLAMIITMGLTKLPAIGMIFGMAGILLVCVIGATLKTVTKNGEGAAIGMKSNTLFAMFGMPIVFMFVGTQINLSVLLNPRMLLVGVVVCVLACVVKGFTAKTILRGDGFTNGERKFAAACCIPKGMTLINLSVAFYPVLQSMNLLYLFDAMIMFAAIALILTIPVGVTLINRADGTWILPDTEAPVDKQPSGVHPHGGAAAETTT